MHTPTHNYDCDYDCVAVFSWGAFQLLVISSHVKQWLYLLLSLLIWPAPISGCPAKIMEQNLTCTRPWVQVKICSILFAGHNLVLSFILTSKNIPVFWHRVRFNRVLVSVVRAFKGYISMSGLLRCARRGGVRCDVRDWFTSVHEGVHSHGTLLYWGGLSKVKLK